MNSARPASLRILCCTAIAVAAAACALDFPTPDELAAAKRAPPTQAAAMSAAPSAEVATEPDAAVPLAPPDGGMLAAAGMPAPPVDTAGMAAPAPMIAPAQPVAGSMANGGSPAPPAEFTLLPTGFRTTATGLTFPPNALPPLNESPAFSWTGVPPEAKSLALVYRDVELDLVRWVIWDIAPGIGALPSGIIPLPSPSEVPGSSQRGGGGAIGYSGPILPDGHSEFTLWALDVAELPNATLIGATRIALERLPQHRIATTPALVIDNS